MSKIKCPWCNHEIDIAMDSCGTGSTWMLLKCSSCGKFAASGSIPDSVKNDPDVKVVRIFGYQDNYTVGYKAGYPAGLNVVPDNEDNRCLGPGPADLTVSPINDDHVALGRRTGFAKAGAVMLGPKAGCAKATNKKL